MNDLLELPLAIATIFLSIAAGFYAQYKRRNRKVDMAGSSILLGYYTDGVVLVPLQSGVVNDMHYTAIATLSNPVPGSDIEPGLLYRVELPFHSQVHLLGIPKQGETVQLDPAGGKSLMERVSLEGDYDSYFSLYAEKEMQQQSRYVLDPKAMVFTIDFCQSHNWEILNSELYFVQATPQAKDDPTPMFDDIAKFVKEIEPAISRPLSDTEIMLRTPYHEERRDNLLCPLCQHTLDNREAYLACPNNHGYLLKGGALAQISRGTIKLPYVVPTDIKENKQNFNCPSCGTMMEKSAYNGGKTIIDTCPHCPYRWLDMGELHT